MNSITDFHEWSTQARLIGLREHTIQYLIEEDLDSIQVIQLLKDDDVDSMKITMGQKIVLKSILVKNTHATNGIDVSTQWAMKSSLTSTLKSTQQSTKSMISSNVENLHEEDREDGAKVDPVIVADEDIDNHVVLKVKETFDKMAEPKVQEMLDKAVSSEKYKAGLYEQGTTLNTIMCIPCKTNITISQQYKYFSNHNAHIKRRSHEEAVKKMNDRNLRKRRFHDEASLSEEEVDIVSD